MRRLPPTIAVLATTLWMSTYLQAEQADAPPREMKVLRKLVGDWNEETLSKAAEWTPEEVRGKGTAKTNPTLGGRFVLSRTFDSEGKLSCMNLLTYDIQRQAYRQWYFGADGATVESSGTWDASTGTLTLENENQGITGVFTIRFVDEDTIQWTIVSKDQQGKVYLDIEGKATRQK